MNVAPQMIAQFFETTDPSYNFSAAEARCECSGFCSSMGQITMHHTFLVRFIQRFRNLYSDA